MTDPIQAIRSDLAFLKAVSEDRGPLPAQFGEHLLAIGLIYGLDFILIWGLFAGLVPRLPGDPWMLVSWLPATILYVPVNLVISRRAPGAVGPSARVFIAAWGAMALMIWAAVAVVIIASARSGVPYYEVWPPIAFVLYGGAWSVAAIIRRERWHWLVAMGCFAVALMAAALVNSPGTWLVMSAGLLLLLAAPGAAIMRQARKPG